MVLTSSASAHKRRDEDQSAILQTAALRNTARKVTSLFRRWSCSCLLVQVVSGDKCVGTCCPQFEHVDTNALLCHTKELPLLYQGASVSLSSFSTHSLTESVKQYLALSGEKLKTSLCSYSPCPAGASMHATPAAPQEGRHCCAQRSAPDEFLCPICLEVWAGLHCYVLCTEGQCYVRTPHLLD